MMYMVLMKAVNKVRMSTRNHFIAIDVKLKE